MAKLVSQYFNHIGSKVEQNLIEDLLIENIRLSGMKIYYIPRTAGNLDPILGEDPLSTFNTVIPLEMYFDDSSNAGWSGDGYLISKFGLEMRESANFIVSRRRFNEAIKRDGFNSMPNTQVTDVEVRPLEGALIYVPFSNDMFQIDRAEHEPIGGFHQLGKLYIWRIDVTKFKYSHEQIKTGLPEIDRTQTVFENVDSTVSDPLAQNDELVTEGTDVISTLETNIFGDPV